MKTFARSHRHTIISALSEWGTGAFRIGGGDGVSALLPHSGAPAYLGQTNTPGFTPTSSPRSPSFPGGNTRSTPPRCTGTCGRGRRRGPEEVVRGVSEAMPLVKRLQVSQGTRQLIEWLIDQI